MLQEVRQAFRSLVRNPALSVPAVLCLALAIGANTAIFSVLDAVLVRPLPFAEPARLIAIQEERHSAEGVNQGSVSPANYMDWTAASRTLADAGVYVDWPVHLTGAGDPVELPAQYVTRSFFTTLGVAPAIGRVFTPAEDAPNGPAAVVVSDGFWRQRLGGARDVLGRVVTIDGEPVTIVGVMPPGFAVPGTAPELWRPLAFDPARDYRATSGRYLQALARLAPGVTIEQADTELRTIAARLAGEHPFFNTGWSTAIAPLREHVVGGTRAPLLVLSGVVLFVLLIACANVANLQIARAGARQRETAVRAALGATRWQVMRGYLAESVLLALVGGGLGLLLAVWGTRALVAAAPADLPRLGEIAVDARTLAFTAVLSIVTGVLFGLAPALHAARADLQHSLRQGGRGSSASAARGALVAAQVALSLVLLIGAGLMIRSFLRLSAVELGFEPAGVLTAQISLPGSRYADSTRQLGFFEELLPRIRAIPGVEAASAVNRLPFAGIGSISAFWVEGSQVPIHEAPSADIKVVDPEYFRTLRIPVLRGAGFTAEHTAASPLVVMVDETLVRTVFAGGDPVGRRIVLPWAQELHAEIIGVVGDVRAAGVDSLPRPSLYWSLAQFPWDRADLVVRAAGDPAPLAAAVARELHAVDPDLPLAEVRPFESYVGASMATRRFVMLLLGAFAAVAVVLSAIGIAGVITNVVVQRTREIGVRLALGAQPLDVLRMVLKQGMTLAAAGIVAGLIGAAVLTRLLRGLLYGTSPTDLLTYAAVALLLATVALVATWVPALRATRVNPITALQAE